LYVTAKHVQYASVLNTKIRINNLARKRAPGGGRKRLDPGKGRTGALTARISHATREMLEREAERNDQSLSREVECRLDRSFDDKDAAPNHIRALAHAVALLATQIERVTGERWYDGAFTGEALRHGIETLIFHFAQRPTGEVRVPPKVEDAAERFQAPLRETFRNPGLLGPMEAGSIISSIESAQSGAKDPAAARFRDPFGYWQILRDIGSGWERNQPIRSKEKQR
jgi:hypothetical protein